MKKIKRLIAEIGKKRYRLVPAASCKGCAFEAKCYRLKTGSHRTGRFDCPVFNDYTLASDIDVIFKEMK